MSVLLVFFGFFYIHIKRFFATFMCFVKIYCHVMAKNAIRRDTIVIAAYSRNTFITVISQCPALYRKCMCVCHKSVKQNEFNDALNTFF